MKKFTIGDLFKHPGYRMTRFVFLSFDLEDETFKAYDLLAQQVVEFHFSDMGDCHKVRTGALDSIRC